MTKMEKGKNMSVLAFSFHFEHLLFSLFSQELSTEHLSQCCLAFTWIVWSVFCRDEQGVLPRLGGLSQVVAAAWNPADEWEHKAKRACLIFFPLITNKQRENFMLHMSEGALGLQYGISC